MGLYRLELHIRFRAATPILTTSHAVVLLYLYLFAFAQRVHALSRADSHSRTSPNTTRSYLPHRAAGISTGTTGNPKGVLLHHRGATMNALGNIVTWSMSVDAKPVYLWTLPMFHCNGWCFPWTIAALTGTHVCLRTVTPSAIFDALADHSVTHFCGAPIVMQMMIGAKPEERRTLNNPVKMMTAASPPPAPVLAAMKKEGIDITHVYGLTEVGIALPTQHPNRLLHRVSCASLHYYFWSGDHACCILI
jgi:acyl-CoA synthetase (AMP-forming)/AMP-acid ligase II